jgi:hypothetical protein
MRDLREKAATGPNAVRMSEAEGSFEIVGAALYPAEDVSAKGKYPKHGDWLETEDGFLECPAALAQTLVEAVDVDDISFPAVVEIESKTIEDERWVLEASVEESD